MFGPVTIDKSKMVGKITIHDSSFYALFIILSWNQLIFEF
jgi:hypothetical protein